MSRQAVTNFLWTSRPQQTGSTTFMGLLHRSPGGRGTPAEVEQSPTRAPTSGVVQQLGVPHGVGSDSATGTETPAWRRPRPLPHGAAVSVAPTAPNFIRGGERSSWQAQQPAG